MQKFQVRQDMVYVRKKKKREGWESPSSAEGEGGHGISRKGWLRPTIWGPRGCDKDLDS